MFVAKLSEDNCRAALVQAQTEVSSSQRLWVSTLNRPFETELQEEWDMQQQVVDKADSVRAGEELDVNAVHNWLKENISASSPSLKAMIQSSDNLPL